MSNNAFDGSLAYEALKRDCDSVVMEGTVEEFEASIADVPRESLLVLAALICDGEVCNGRFRQFFRNSSGGLAPEAVGGFDLLGFPVCANALRDAMALFGQPYPRAVWERHRIMEELEFPGGDPKMVTEYDADTNAILNKWHIITRKPFVEPFATMDEAYFSVAGVGAVGKAADAYVARTR